jgi:chemosensory pili system protein ChpC
MGWSAPKERPAGAPPWLLGLMDWQGAKIPLVSFEAACGQSVPQAKNRTRIAVMQAIGGILEPPAIAVATQGYPYLLRVNANVMRGDDSPDPVVGPVLARIRMANERPVIPDLETLEQMVAKVLGIEARVPEAAPEAVEPAVDLDADDVIIDDDGVTLEGETTTLDALEDTVPDPSAPETARPPGELGGLDDTLPASEGSPGEGTGAVEEESIELSGDLGVGEETPEAGAGGDAEYEIDLENLKLDDEP